MLCIRSIILKIFCGTVDDTKRYLLVQPKKNGTMSVTIKFGDRTNNRIYYKDFADGAVDLTQCVKGSTDDDKMGRHK